MVIQAHVSQHQLEAWCHVDEDVGKRGNVQQSLLIIVFLAANYIDFLLDLKYESEICHNIKYRFGFIHRYERCNSP